MKEAALWLWQIVLTGTTVAGLIGVAVWMARDLITTRLTKAVQHEFDEKLENVRSKLRSTEGELQSLRSSALSGSAQRQGLIDKRTLEAIDQIWSGVIALGKMKFGVTMLAAMPFETVAERATRDAGLRKFFGAFAPDPQSMNVAEARQARLWVSPLAWALYNAYSSVTGYAAMQLHLLKAGMKTDLADSSGLVTLVKLALPHYSDYLDKNGAAGAFMLLEQLEDELLKELRRMMDGTEADRAAIDRAAAIVKQSGEVQAQMVRSQAAAAP